MGPMRIQARTDSQHPIVCRKRDLYRATSRPAVTRDLGFSGLIRRTTPLSRLLRHAWGCGGPILTRILTGGTCMSEIKYTQAYIQY
jgi:hypothetical protein